MVVSKMIRANILAAYERAQSSRAPPVDCYRAGVAAWRIAFPDHAPRFAARQAVALILNTHCTLRPN